MSAVPTPAASPWLEATVDEVQRHGPRALSLFLNSPLPPHQAGQHVDIRLVAEDGYEARRSYSIASAPGAARLELLIERLDNGEVSPYFHEVTVAGDVLELRGPIGGHFVWRASQPGPLLLVAGGSGIAPLMAMLRHRAATRAPVDTLLLYSARTWDELVYRDELAMMAAQDTRLHFTAVTTREPARRPGDFSQRLDRAALAAALQRWGRQPQDVYVCGATGFVETVAAALVDLGVPASSIRTERYGGLS
ncbi:MAG TPA: ferredoxin reductase [Ideonella sp.]|uniref:ferredoxin reductase n=1 Tax=Ideonella sp. TaxID=1929293 RepID=UPI002C89C734|nr:ferredoxin reductase [Ideonella sp.]HSI47643.1 ferredoxin reductase [Ideonella sp.]